jgi:hypothetical protein
MSERSEKGDLSGKGGEVEGWLIDYNSIASISIDISGIL